MVCLRKSWVNGNKFEDEMSGVIASVPGIVGGVNAN